MVQQFLSNPDSPKGLVGIGDVDTRLILRGGLIRYTSIAAG